MTVRNMTLIQLGLQPFFCWCQSRQNEAMRRKCALRLALQRENERDRENAAPRRDRDSGEEKVQYRPVESKLEPTGLLVLRLGAARAQTLFEKSVSFTSLPF